jgi:hypothetical protein
MARYSTAHGVLVTQGSSSSPASARVITRPELELEERIGRALATGRCSVCELEAPSRSLDASGRCKECQS